MSFIETDSSRIYYEQHGRGPALVCISGLAATHDAWSLMLPALAARYKTVVFDNRGVGQTTAVSAPFDIEQMADDTFKGCGCRSFISDRSAG